MARHANPAVREFILRNLDHFCHDITTQAAQKFELSRTAINNNVQRLIEEGLIEARGKTRARRYKLKPLVSQAIHRNIDYLWTEDDLWRQNILPLMTAQKQNVINICHYGVTEMVNNVLDHATSQEIIVYYEQNYAEIKIYVVDKGIGIFEKIQKDFRLADPRAALLELSKGRLTSDRKRHAGEGIYFTSRMFDEFCIRSSTLFYSRKKRDGDDWLVEINDRTARRQGTLIQMSIKTDANWTTQDVFNECQGDTLKFRKTHVPVQLAQYPGEQLVSRSQAKRLLARFENFSEVFLDFDNVEQIGQPFADEIFRIFVENHPEISIRATNANKNIERMIAFVLSGEPEEPKQASLFD